MAAPPPTRSSAPSAAGAASSPPPNLCQSRWRCSHCTEEQPGVTLSLSLGHCCGRRTVVCTAQLRDDRTRRALRAPPHTEIRRCTAPDAHAAVGARSRSARKRPQTLPRTTASRNPLPRSRLSMTSLQECLTPHTHAPAHDGNVPWISRSPNAGHDRVAVSFPSLDDKEHSCRRIKAMMFPATLPSFARLAATLDVNHHP